MAEQPIVVDGALFLGMHADDEPTRRTCKTFFVRRLSEQVWMSLEQVGWCDDVVWSYPRAAQDAYYPFMDTLHSEMAIRRGGYDEPDLAAALETTTLHDLPVRERLLMARVLRCGAALYTTNARLTDRGDLPASRPPPSGEESFPAHLERLYQNSLALRIPTETVRGARCTPAPLSR